MMGKFFLAVFFLLCCSIVSAVDKKTVYAKNFDIIPNTSVDQSEKIRGLLKYCKDHKIERVFFEPGRYDFWPEHANFRSFYISNTSSETETKDKTKHIGFLIENQSNLQIIAQDALFMYHGKMTPFAIVNSENISIKGLRIDFERPTMSEFSVQVMNKDSLLIQVHKDSKYRLQDNRLIWYGHNWTADRHMMHAVVTDPRNGQSRYADYQAILRASLEELSEGKLLFRGKFSKIYAPGSIISVRNTIRDEVGGFVYRSKNILLDGFQIHYMHGLGITSQFSENLIYRNINIEPANGRTVAAFADGMQFSGCKGNIIIENCNFSGLHDDPINVHGTYLQVREMLSKDEVVVEFKHHQSYGFDAFIPGDTVQFVDKNAISPIGQQYTVESVKRLSLTEVQLKLDRATPESLSIGDTLENITWNAAVTIRNCKFSGTNTRGLLVSTPKKVLIEKNTFYKTGMHAILIAADVNSWYESGAVKDVLIRKNSFVECGYNQPGFSYAIAILPEVKKPESGKYVHRNIRIKDNKFQLLTDQAVVARNVDGLTFSRNTLHSQTTASAQKKDKAAVTTATVSIQHSENIQIFNNKANFTWRYQPN